MTQGRKAGMLPYGNGCRLYPDCFTCPGPPGCIWPYGINRDKQEMLIKLWEPFFKKELVKAKALGGKG